MIDNMAVSLAHTARSCLSDISRQNTQNTEARIFVVVVAFDVSGILCVAIFSIEFILI